MKLFAYVTLGLFMTAQAFAQEPSGGAPVADCHTDGSPEVPATVADTVPVLVAIAPDALNGGAGGYQANSFDKGSQSVLVLGGISKAGDQRGFFGPGAIYYDAVKKNWLVGAGWSGMTGATGIRKAAGDITLNVVHPVLDRKPGQKGEFAVAGMVNANINAGSDAYNKGLTTHSGVSPAIITTFTVDGKNTINGGIARSFGDSNASNFFTNAEWDHQLTPSLTAYLGNQSATGNGNASDTLFAGSGYTPKKFKKFQILGSYSQDLYNNSGTNNRTASFGLFYTIK